MTDANPTAPRQAEGLGPKGWLLIVSAVLLIVFFAINSQKVEVHFLVTTVDLPLIVALLIAALLGSLVGWAVPRIRRSRGTSQVMAEDAGRRSR